LRVVGCELSKNTRPVEKKEALRTRGEVNGVDRSERRKEDA